MEAENTKPAVATAPQSPSEGLLANTLGFAALVTLLITNLGVLLRYVFAVPMAWNEEIVKLIFVWMIFIGFALDYKRGSLAGILFFEEGFRKRGNLLGFRCVKFIQGLINFVFGLFCTYEGLVIMDIQIDTEEVTTVLELPLYWISAGFTIGFAMFTCYAGLNLLRTFKSKL